MFKIGSSENLICEAMEKNLISNKLDSKYGFNKLARAAEYLEKAANIFDVAGMQSEAEDITNILNKLSEDLEKSK